MIVGKGGKMEFVIESNFTYKGVRYGVGEKVPEGISAEEKEQLFRHGRLAKVDGEKITRFQREIELNDEQIAVLLTQPLAVIEATLQGGSFSEQTIGKISIGAIQKNLLDVSKFLQDKFKPKNILDAKEKVKKVEEVKEVKSVEGKEEFKCSCGKEFKNARALRMHRTMTKHPALSGTTTKV